MEHAVDGDSRKSGPRLVIAAVVTAVLAGLASCGGGAHDSATLTSSPKVSSSTPSTRSESPSESPVSSGVAIGPSIEADDETPYLEAQPDEQHIRGALAAYHESIVVVTELFRSPDQAESETRDYSLWDPASGSLTHSWTGSPGLQDVIWDEDGDWLATVRTGMSLPFDTWSIILRNPNTGEERIIASSDPGVARVPGLRLGASGFEPMPSIWRDKVVWAEWATDGSANAVERVRLFDLTTGATSTVAQITNPTVEAIQWPSIGGGKIAWLSSSEVGQPTDIVVHDIATGEEQRIPSDGDIYSSALSKDGRFLVWDDYKVKWALDTTTGEKVQYADHEGWGTYLSGHYVSWTPAASQNQPGGFYDFTAKRLRLLRVSPDTITNIAQAMGGWFVWQDLPFPGGQAHYDQSKWYALRLEQTG